MAGFIFSARSLYYRVALEEQYPDRTLYLAVPLGTYQTFFSLQFIQTVIQRFEVKVIVLAFHEPFVRQYTGFAVG